MEFTLISNQTVEKEIWDDGKSSPSLVNKTIFSFLTSYNDLEVDLYYSSNPDAMSPNWYLFSSGWGAHTISKVKEGSLIRFTLSVDISPLLEKLIAPGSTYQLKVRLKRSGYVNVENLLSDVCRRAKGNSKSNISFNYTVLEHKNAVAGYRGVDFGITVSAWPSLINKDVAYPQLRDVTIKMTGESGSYVSSSLYYTFWKEKTELITQYYQKGKTTFQVIVTDAAGKKFIFEERKYTDLASISFPGMPSFVAPDIYNPHEESENNTLEIRHSYANAVGTSGQQTDSSPSHGIKNIIYNYVFTKGSVSKTISGILEEDGDLIKVSFPRSLLVSEGIFGENQLDGKGIISIKVNATDAFGKVAYMNGSVNYDFYLSPTWESNEQIKIMHSYLKTSGNQEVYHGPLEEYTSTNPDSRNLNLRYYCTKEKAKLILPLAIDPNGQNITYEIEMAQGRYFGVLSDVSANNITFSKIGQVVAASGQQSYIYEIPDGAAREEDRYCYFRVKAKDSRNAELDYKLSTFILISRTQKPTFKITSTELGAEGNNLTVKFNKENFDLGDSPYYDSFTRGSYYYTPSATITITASRSPGFEESAQTVHDTLDYERREGLEGLGTANWEKTLDVSGWDEIWKQEKIYVKLELTIWYNAKNTLSTQPYVYFTIIGGIPTVAHRKNQVGINTVGFTISDSLRIAPVDNRTLITFEFLEGNPVSLDLTNREAFKTSLREILGI